MRSIAVGLTLSLLSTGTFAQSQTVPIQVAQDQSGGAASSGGATSGGSTSSAPAAEAAPASAPTQPQALEPGPEAGASSAAALSDTVLLGIAAAALVAGIAIGVTSGHHGASTTTTTGK